MKEKVLLNRALKNWARMSQVEGGVETELERRCGWREQGPDRGGLECQTRSWASRLLGHSPMVQGWNTLEARSLIFSMCSGRRQPLAPPQPPSQENPCQREDIGFYQPEITLSHITWQKLWLRASSNCGQAMDCLSHPWADFSHLWDSVSLSWIRGKLDEFLWPRSMNIPPLHSSLCLRGPC